MKWEKLLELMKKRKAKPDKSIYHHSLRAKEIAKELLSKIPYDKGLKDCLLLQVFLHDVGKLDDRFQEKLEGKRKRAPPHAYLGIELASRFLDCPEPYKTIALASILTHHSDLHEGLYQGEIEGNEKLIVGNAVLSEPADLVFDIRESILSGDLEDYGLDPIEIRSLYTLFNGLLRVSDWLESAGLSPDSYHLKDGVTVWEGVENYLEGKGFSLRPYQRLVMGKGGGYFLLPTGDGKTETSLLATPPGSSKVMYSLPTITTTEAMRRRFESMFDESLLSFSHSMLFLSLYRKGALDEKLLHRYAMRPIFISTVDQVLLALLNYPRFPVREFALRGAHWIIDEIHAYSPFTLSLIIEAIEYAIKYLGTKVTVMSATLPSAMAMELENRGLKPLIPFESVKDRYRSRKRVEVKVRSEPLETAAEDVAREQGRVLVVANTVTRAIKIYEMLKEKRNDVYLFHSRFTTLDRERKMKLVGELKKGILIATQVVEVSLDIDYDILYTDAAPIDSLIQRFGRVNRRGKKKGRAYVFEPEGKRKYLPYDRDAFEKGLNFLGELENVENELELLNLNDEFYSEIWGKYENKLRERPLERVLRTVGRWKRSEDWLSTRDTFISLPAIPRPFLDEAIDLSSKWENLTEEERLRATIYVIEHTVNVPIWILRDSLLRNDDLYERFGVFGIDADYNPEKGVVPRKEGVLMF